MTRTIALGLAFAAACVSPDETSDAEGLGGKYDGAGSGSSTYFVYDNGIRCVTAPCPSYTAISQTGERIEVSEVELPFEATTSAIDSIAWGGVVAEGTLRHGSWMPGDVGTVLGIERIIGAAEQYLVLEIGRPPVERYRAIASDGTIVRLTDVDLTDLRAAPDEPLPTLDGLTRGRWATCGFVATNPAGQTLLFSTMRAGFAESAFIRPSGVACTRIPCPAWTVELHDGTVEHAAQLDLSYLHMGATDEAALLDAMTAGALVTGWLHEGRWTAGGRGDTLFVVGLPD